MQVNALYICVINRTSRSDVPTYDPTRAAQICSFDGTKPKMSYYWPGVSRGRRAGGRPRGACWLPRSGRPKCRIPVLHIVLPRSYASFMNADCSTAPLRPIPTALTIPRSTGSGRQTTNPRNAKIAVSAVDSSASAHAVI